MAEQIVNIHGFKVKYDDSSDTLKNAIHYLGNKIDRAEAQVFFDAARHDLVNKKAHFEVHNHEHGHDDNLTLLHEDGVYHLRKRLNY